METAKDVIAKLQARTSHGGGTVREWYQMIPKGSKWFPGSQADPACAVCHGLGYVRFDVPMSSEYFGKAIVCDCVPEMERRRAQQKQRSEEKW